MHQRHRQRLLRAHLARGKQHLGGMGLANHTWQYPRDSMLGHQPAPGEGGDELSVLRGDANVGVKREDQPEPAAAPLIAAMIGVSKPGK